jgi:hypothetical protein
VASRRNEMTFMADGRVQDDFSQFVKASAGR